MVGDWRQNGGAGMEADELGIVATIQVCGHLFKMPTSGKHRRWVRRFFVLKDGFLLYYPERKAPFLQFDPHPKVRAVASRPRPRRAALTPASRRASFPSAAARWRRRTKVPPPPTATRS